MQTNIESTVKQDKGNKCTVGKIFGHEKNVGFEPRTSHLLFTILVTERPRVQIPVSATFFFHVRKFAIFSYCASPGWCERQALLLSRHQ